MISLKQCLFIGCCLLLTACQTGPNARSLPADAPKSVKLGKPYTIKGTTYYPQYDPSYAQTGIASWYGPGFHGKQTASGEMYDQYAMTAAHPTLPMPSLVRVTNLENGQATVVRVNDRGPFAPGRIIDLSKRAAETIGVKGISKVRIEYLKEETEQYWASSDINPSQIAGRKSDLASPSSSYDEPEYTMNPEDLEPSQPAPIMSVSSSQLVEISRDGKQAGRLSDASAPPYPDSPAAPGIQKPVIANSAPREQSEAPWQSADADAGAQPQGDAYNRNADPPGNAGYFIQAGAFSSRSNADRLMQQLSAVGPARVEDLPRQSGVLYRVRLGPYTSHDEASDSLHDVFKLGIKDAKVVAER